MVIILNAIPFLIGFAFACYALVNWGNKKKCVIATVVSALALLMIHSLTPSYAPKGTVPKLTIKHDQIPKTELPEIKSRLLKPSLTEDERDARNKELFDAVRRAQKSD